jgi:hypothetical protein
MKKRGPRIGTKGSTPIHISVSVESINPCATNTPIRTPTFRQPNIIRKTIGSTSSQGEATGGASLGSGSQVSTLRRGSCSTFKMTGHDPTIRLPIQGRGIGGPQESLFHFFKRSRKKTRA